MTIHLFYYLLENYGQPFIMAILSSFIFFLIIIYFPQKRANLNTNSFLLNAYKDLKVEIVELILMELRKVNKNRSELQKNIYNYDYIRSLITEDDITAIRDLDESTMKELASTIHYNLIQIQFFLSIELSKNYIQEHAEANERISYLIQWINQFGYFMHTVDLNHEYDKYLRNDLQSFVRGRDTINGDKEFDDLPRIIENAYKNSLFKFKWRNLITNPCRKK